MTGNLDMLSPFPPTSSKPGHGEVHLTLLPPATPSFSTLTYTYPLKLLPSTPHTLEPTPQSTNQDSPTQSANPTNSTAQPAKAQTSIVVPRPTNVPLLFLLTYGGGLLAGDTISLEIELDPGTRLTLTTQGSTKVYRPPPPPFSNSDDTSTPLAPTTSNPPPTTRQDLVVKIARGAALWLAPDPVQPFAGSLYAQSQVFELERGASLGMVDWVSEGRTSRGEQWDFQTWRGRNEIWSSVDRHDARDGEGEAEAEAEMKGKRKGKRTLLVRDAVILEGEDVRGRMEGMGVFGTVLLRGPVFEGLGAFFVGEFEAMPRIGGRDWGRDTGGEAEVEVSTVEAWRKRRVAREKKEGVVWTACRVRGVFVIKFSAREVEGARWWLGDMLRTEGMVGEDFGDGGLMFVR